MANRSRVEVLCGLGALAFGVLALAVAFLQPHLESNAIANNVFTLRPGFTAMQVPYLLAAGVPLLGIVLGAIAGGLTGAGALRLLLWVATAVLGVEVLLGSISDVGILVVPSFLFGLWASLAARTAHANGADATRRSA